MNEVIHKICFLIFFLFVLMLFSPVFAADEKTSKSAPVDTKKSGGDSESKAERDKRRREETRKENMRRQIEAMLLIARSNERPGGNELDTCKNYEAALDGYVQILEKADPEGEQLREALLGKGRCLARIGRLWPAFEAVEASFPPKFDAKDIKERIDIEFSVAERLQAMGDKKVPECIIDGKSATGTEAAVKIYLAIGYNDPLYDRTPVGLLRSADYLAKMGKAEEAEKIYNRLAHEYENRLEGYLGKASLAKIIIERSAKAGMDERTAKEVDGLLQSCKMATDDTGRLKLRIRAALLASSNIRAGKLMEEAKFYLKKGRKGRKSAIFMLKSIVDKYPGTDNAVTAREILKKMGVTVTGVKGVDGDGNVENKN